ncbi:MAG: hypothetical protein WCS15_09390 [Prevotella sp.]
MKKLLVSTFLVAAIACACWFTQANFNSNYIAGVNNYFSHYNEATTVEGAVYHNGQSVSMPLTVFVKISHRTGDDSTSNPITTAALQYKILPSGSWVTVKTYTDPDWSMSFDKPIALFGRNCINLDLPTGTELLIRLYLTDGIYETGSLSTDITSTVPDTATLASGGTYEGGWSAPHVMRVKIAGIRPSR